MAAASNMNDLLDQWLQRESLGEALTATDLITEPDKAVELDRKLRALWSQHPRFVLVPHNDSFFKKISFGLAALEGIVAQLAGVAAARRGAPKKAPRKKRCD